MYNNACKTFCNHLLRFYARQQNASHVLAIVEVSVRLSVRPSVTLRYCVKTRQARITKSLLWAATRILVYRDKILCPLVRGFSSNESVKDEYPFKRCHLPLLARIVWKRMQIGTYMMHIITSTGDGLFTFINFDDLKRP